MARKSATAGNKAELKLLVDASQRLDHALWVGKFRLYRDLFPWFLPALKQLAGLPPADPLATDTAADKFTAAVDDFLRGSRSRSPEVVALHRKAAEAWTDLTGLPPLTTVQNWQAAAAAAGIDAADWSRSDFEAVFDAIRAFVLAKAAAAISDDKTTWSRPTTKAALEAALGISRETLNQTLATTLRQTPGKIRHHKPSPRTLVVALEDLPPALQARFGNG